MQNKSKIELGDDEIEEFKLFRLVQFLAGSDSFEYLKHEKIKDGRLIIHLKTYKKLTKN